MDKSSLEVCKGNLFLHLKLSASRFSAPVRRMQME